MPSKPFEFTLQFSAGLGQIDEPAGTLIGVTVAEVGPATGHFAYVDKANKVLGVGGSSDAEQFPTADRRLQLAMDEQSLMTVIAAAKNSKRVKTREDHDDSVGSRAGFAENFRMKDGKVVCDQTIFQNYANRGVFFDTAQQTPELIGLSGDFKFTAEVKGDAALMRVTRIDAVDIVDKGALTHAGLFSVKPQVDTPSKETSAQPFTLMAKAAPEKPDFKAFKQACADMAAWRTANANDAAEIDDAMSGLLPPKIVGNASPVAGPLSAMTASEKTELTTELTASFSALLKTSLAEATTKIAADADAKILEMRKQFSALGLKPTPTKEPTAEELAAAKKQADELALKAAAAAGASTGDDFFTLRASIMAERKISKNAASNVIASERPEVFEAYRVKLGQLRPKNA